MRTITLGGLLACAILVLLILGTPTPQSFAAKPVPPPPLPPVRYHIQYWALPTPIPTKQFGMNTMNNLGQVAGWYINAAGEQRAYLYDPEINPTAAVDVETEFAPAGIPAGWKIAGTIGINNHGLLVGYLSPVGTGYGAIHRACVLDLAAATPQVVLLPNWGDWVSHYASKVNDNGDILGVYENDDGSNGLYFYNPNDPNSPYFLDGVQTLNQLNNPVGDRPAQVAGTFIGAAQAPFRWTPQTNTLETFGSMTTYGGGIYGLNDAGMLCGSTQVVTGKPSRTTTNPFRLNTSVQLLSNAYGIWGESINSSGDVLLSPGGGIYRDDWSSYGNYADINKLVVGTSADLTFWASALSRELYRMNDRGSLSNAGQIAGRLLYSNGNAFQPFLLTPVAP